MNSYSRWTAGLAVIRAFSDENDMLMLADVARLTGMSRASARRFLLTLQTLGYVGHKQGRFFLRPRVLDLGYAFLSSSSSVEVTQDHLDKLSLRIGESCSACEYDDGDVVYIARAAADRIMTIRLSVGRRLPAFCTSTGRVFLASFDDEELDTFLRTYPREQFTAQTLVEEQAIREAVEEVREQGWALNNQELRARSPIGSGSRARHLGTSGQRRQRLGGDLAGLGRAAEGGAPAVPPRNDGPDRR